MKETHTFLHTERNCLVTDMIEKLLLELKGEGDVMSEKEGENELEKIEDRERGGAPLNLAT